jgi:hypothetical protein
MLFKEIIAVYSENDVKTHKYEMISYWLLKQAVRIVTIWL